MTDGKWQSETNRKSQAERLSLALESARAGTWEWDVRTNENVWSDELWGVYGIEPDSCAPSYDAWRNLVHPLDLESAENAIQTALRLRTPLEFEWRTVAADGSIRWLLSRGRPLMDPDGGLGSYIGVVIDITSQKQAEVKVEQLKRLYATVSQINQTIVRMKTPRELYVSICEVAAIHGGFAVTSIALVDEEGGRPVLRLVSTYGRSLEEMPFRTLPLDDPRFEESPLLKAVRTGKVHAMVETSHSLAAVPFRQGGKVVGLLNLTATETSFFDADEELKLLEETGLDITYALDAMENEARRQEAEERLRASEEVYRIVSESANDWTYWKARDGSVRFCSPSVEKLTGYPAEEFVAHPERIETILHPEDRSRFLEHQATIGRENCEGLDFRIVTKSGETRWIRHSCNPVVGPDGVTDGRRGTNQDSTVRKTAELALRESETRLKTVFDSSPDAIFITDADRRILDANRVASERYGYTLEEFRAMSARDTAPEGLRAMAPEIIEDAVRTGHPIELQTLTKSGSLVQEEVVFRTIELQGRPCLFSSARDIEERVRGEQKTQKQLQRLRALHAIDMMITSSFDVKQSLNILIDQAVAQLEVDAAAILLLEDDGRTLGLAASRGFLSRAMSSLRVRVGEGFAGRAALERRILHVPDLRVADIGYKYRSLLPVESFVTYFGVPMLAKGVVIGVLEVYHRSPLEPDTDWLDFLETLAGQAALAIDYAKLFNELQRSNAEIGQAYEATIDGWSRAMEMRDQETEGHTRRVAEMTTHLANVAGIDLRLAAHIRHGALLHDIGKLGVPDSILLKPGPLTVEERETMQKHPRFAYELLTSIEYLREAIDIPYCHHEWWDGTGYPRGLKGEEIPYIARLFAVIDVWDALRSDRPYRRGFPEPVVHEMLRRESGTHFDPKAVALFFQVLDENVGFADENP